MGRESVAEIGPGQAVRIPTGGMLPVGADAVLMQEYTVRQDAASIQAMRPVLRRENLILRGDDVAAGVIVLSSGCRIGAPDLGVLASCGFSQVQVVKKPVVTIVITGDEIVPPEVVPEPGQIRDVNSFTLAALAETAGCEVIHAPRVPDSLAGLTAVLQAALQKSDLILISGGSSVGDRDYTTGAVQSLPGVKTLFHGVALKPGKPTLMAMMDKTAIFGIPGHTVAAMTVFHEIVEPALAARQGMPCSEGRFVIPARLGTRLRSDAERDEIVRVRLEQTGDGLVAWPLPAKSGLITVMTRAQGMIYIPAGQPERQIGDMVEVQVLVGRVCGNWRGVSQ
jgi:molybdopterin molybdotransferase